MKAICVTEVCKLLRFTVVNVRGASWVAKQGKIDAIMLKDDTWFYFPIA